MQIFCAGAVDESFGLGRNTASTINRSLAIYLSWLAQFKPNCFVANWIAGIQTKSSNISWRHVQGKESPADIISRGCKVSELQNTSWFTGPTFLKLEEHLWPQSLDKIETIDADLEIRKISSLKCTESKENILEQILN